MIGKHLDEPERARIAAELAYENLSRLGESWERSRDEYQRLCRDRDAAVRGVARWGFSQKQLAAAARLTPQRVGQILAAAPEPRITELR